MKRYSVLAIAGITAAAVLWIVAGSKAQDSGDSSQWPVAGHDLNNTRNQPAENQINPDNVHLLTTKWAFTTAGNVSATPTVFGDAVYFPDWGGNLYAVRPDNGQAIWSHAISDYDGFAGAVSRGSPPSMATT